MIVSIVGCGQSAKEWYKTPCDLSIGVNDCLKWGHQVDWLCVVNFPSKFRPSAKNGHRDRLSTITSSEPKRLLCHNAQWREWFPAAELLQLRPFRGTVTKGKITYSTTSPFIAINLAYGAGAKDIVLWGVDFLDHPVVKDKARDRELNEYRRLFEALEGKGVTCWLGDEGSALSKYLKTWN